MKVFPRFRLIVGSLKDPLHIQPWLMKNAYTTVILKLSVHLALCEFI